MPKHKSEDYKLSAVQYYLGMMFHMLKLVNFLSVLKEV